MVSEKMREIILLPIVGAILFAQITIINAQAPLPIKGRLLTADEGCGFSKVSNARIVGGAPAKPGQYPWMALLGAIENNTMDFFCGGSLITSRHVLTAAHCITSDLAIVRLGEHDTSTIADGQHQDIQIIQVVIHPHYTKLNQGDGTNDVAILVLERDVNFNDRIGPVCLPVEKNIQSMSFVGQNPFAAGWGRTKYGGKGMSDVLKHLQVKVRSNDACETAYLLHLLFYLETVKPIQFIESVICAGNLLGGPGIDSGDSGSALVLPILENGKFPMYQIGISALTLAHARPFTPGIYTRVTYFMDWIQQTISRNK